MSAKRALRRLLPAVNGEVSDARFLDEELLQGEFRAASRQAYREAIGRLIARGALG
jgi:aspartate/glutamate racemase